MSICQEEKEEEEEDDDDDDDDDDNDVYGLSWNDVLRGDNNASS